MTPKTREREQTVTLDKFCMYSSIPNRMSFKCPDNYTSENYKEYKNK